MQDLHAATRTLVVSQTSPPLSPRPGTQYYLTAVVGSQPTECVRLGVEAVVQEALPRYRLPNGHTMSALSLVVTGALRPMNARTAYRLHPHEKTRMEITLLRDGERYRSGQDFLLYDLSVGGLGLVIPRQVGGRHNPLLAVAARDRMAVELDLGLDGERERTAVQCEFLVVQMNRTHNEASVYAGGRMLGLDARAEQALGRFVARAQLVGASGRIA